MLWLWFVITLLMVACATMVFLHLKVYQVYRQKNKELRDKCKAMVADLERRKRDTVRNKFRGFVVEMVEDAKLEYEARLALSILVLKNEFQDRFDEIMKHQHRTKYDEILMDLKARRELGERGRLFESSS